MLDAVCLAQLRGLRLVQIGVHERVDRENSGAGEHGNCCSSAERNHPQSAQRKPHGTRDIRLAVN